MNIDIDEMFEEIDRKRSRWDTRQTVRYWLIHWYYYDHNMDILNEAEFNNARKLYYRLSYLSDEERSILAYIYYYDTYKKFKSNKSIGEKYNIKAHKVTEFKNKIIDKMKIVRSQPYTGDDTQIKAHQLKIKQALDLIQCLVPNEYRDK